MLRICLEFGSQGIQCYKVYDFSCGLRIKGRKGLGGFRFQLSVSASVEGLKPEFRLKQQSRLCMSVYAYVYAHTHVHIYICIHTHTMYSHTRTHVVVILGRSKAEIP